MKNDDGTGDAGTLSNPLSFVHSGSFYWLHATLNARNFWGNFWSLRSIGTLSSNVLGFFDTGLIPQGGNEHGYGFAVRATNPSPISLILAIL